MNFWTFSVFRGLFCEILINENLRLYSVTCLVTQYLFVYIYLMGVCMS